MMRNGLQFLSLSVRGIDACSFLGRQKNDKTTINYFIHDQLIVPTKQET